MSKIFPFIGLTPKPDLAEKICSPPYDVMNKSEAKEMVATTPQSFLRIIRPEVNINTESGDHSLHKIAKEQLALFIKEGLLEPTQKPSIYIYEIKQNNHIQTGIVAGASVEEYENNQIKKHELTRPDKEEDRTQHILTVGAQTGPVFLTYHQQHGIKELIKSITKNEADIGFTASDNIQHKLWIVTEDDTIHTLIEAFNSVPNLYVADGHHRSAAASNVKNRIEENNLENKYSNYHHFLAVIFPSDELNILDYNRVLKDLNQHSASEILEKIKENFLVSLPENNFEQIKPTNKNEIAMYIENNWYKLTYKTPQHLTDVVDKLAVSILQNTILEPIFGIQNPRTDARIDFVGGIRGHMELEKRCQTDAKCAFRLYPTSIDELMEIADNNELMPPKSTWFEPKLRSGLITKPIQ